MAPSGKRGSPAIAGDKAESAPAVTITIDQEQLLKALPQLKAPEAPALQPRQAMMAESHSIYTVVRTIDQGGMGIVYEALDQRLNRGVALKVMLRHDDPQTMQQFIEEAQVTSQLEHPNVVPMHELGVDGEGRLYFSMKLVRGETLAAHLHRWRHQPLTPARLYEALTIIIKVCDGLSFAHDRGVIHRDIKPANIMIGEYGEVLVMDWGIARVLSKGRSPMPRTGAGPSDGQPLSLDATSQTREGDVIGTPGYMSPEQARGDLEKLGPATDIYSVGALIYELLTGSKPCAGSSASEVITQTIEGRIIPPRDRRPDRPMPPELEAVALKALATDPARRYASAGSLSLDLQSFLAGRSVSARPDHAGLALIKLLRRNRAMAVAVGIVLAVSIGSFIHVMHQRDVAQQALEARDVAQTQRSAAENARTALVAAQAERSQRRMQAFDPYAQATDLLGRGTFTQEAIQLLKRSVAIDPDFSEAHFALGEALRASGEPKLAAEEYIIADTLSQRSSHHCDQAAQINAAFCLDEAGEYNRSLELFTRAEMSDPGQALGLVGRCYRLAEGPDQDLQGSLSAAQAAVAREPRLWEVHLAHGYALLINSEVGILPLSRCQEAERELRIVTQMAPQHPEPLIWLMEIASLDPRRALEMHQLMDQAIALEPRNGILYLDRCLIRHRDQDVTGWTQDIQRAQELGASAIALADERAKLAQFQNDGETALRLYQQVARSSTLTTSCYNWLNYAIRMGRLDGIGPEVDHFIAQHPGNIFAALLEAAWDEAHGRSAHAVTVVVQALQRAPYNRTLHQLHGLCLLADHRSGEALAVIMDNLAQDPGDAELSKQRIQVLVSLRRMDDAHAAYKEFIAGHPDLIKDVEALRVQMGW